MNKAKMTLLYKCISTLYLSLWQAAPHTITRFPTLLSQDPANSILKEHKYVVFKLSPCFNCNIRAHFLLVATSDFLLQSNLPNRYIYPVHHVTNILHPPAYEDGTDKEFRKSAIKTQTQGNYPKRNILQFVLSLKWKHVSNITKLIAKPIVFAFSSVSIAWLHPRKTTVIWWKLRSATVSPSPLEGWNQVLWFSFFGFHSTDVAVFSQPPFLT